jgi:large repetitive protein
LLPTQPRIVVFWSQVGSNPPQPEAVLVDATEPIWRTRPYPAQVIDSSGPVDATRWVLRETEWLQLQDASAAGVLAANGLVKAPGLQRAIVVLAPGARGKQLRLDLVAIGFPSLPFLGATEQRTTVLDLRLARAPWEED